MATVDCPDSPATLSLAEVLLRIQEISTLPHIAVRIMEVANDPNSGAREVKNIMEADAALSTRVLRCVNSSAYATRTKIANLQHAIAYLGVKQIRNLAMTASVSSLFQKDEQIGTYNRRQLWRHLVAVGICARMIARRIRLSHFEDVFLAGLLHDLGIILEDQHVHGPFLDVLRSLGPGKTLPETERRHLGFDHTTLGEQVARQWTLPCGVIDTVRHHHHSASYRGSYRDTVQCVEVANYLCSAKGISAIGLHLVEAPCEAILAIGLGKEDLLVFADDLDRELSVNQMLLQL
jgi:putative nucleotidyltransferase with HDIG domain